MTAAVTVDPFSLFRLDGTRRPIQPGEIAALADTINNMTDTLETFADQASRAEVAGLVRMIRDDIEVTGRGWTYDHRAKKVSLAADVRIVFAAQLNDILK